MNKEEIASSLLKKYAPETFSSFEYQDTKFVAKGLVGSGMSVFASCFYEKYKRSQLWVLESKEDAAYFFNDLEQLLDKKVVMFYPATSLHPYQIEDVDNANILFRAEVLSKLQTSDSLIIVTYPEALFEKVIHQSTIDKNIFNLSTGHKIDLDFLNENLFEYHFKQVDFVSEPGEFSVRGGIIDVFSYDNETPYRIEFFGNEIESIRLFDVESQLSLNTVNNFNLIPNLDHKDFSEDRQSFFKAIPSDSVLFFTDISSTFIRTEALFQKAVDNFDKYDSESVQRHPTDLFNTAENHKTSLNLFKVVECSSSPYYKDSAILNFLQQPQPPFNRQFDLLISSLNKYHDKGFKCYIACDSASQSKRFEDIFRDIGKEVHYSILKIKLHKGFIDSNLKICCFTDHEIFNRYHNFKLGKLNSKKQAYSIKNYNTLSIGDYVTHIDHGIGVFSGLKKIDVGGKKQEAIKLIYGDRDILYVSIHSLHKISKYSNKDNTPPKIFKLGSKAWASLKEKTKRRIKELAFNLIDLYAKRTLKKGFAFDPDSYLQHELEASFIYEDTPDQITATAAVKADMENQTPMDRLICGDVGFGKTEIAIRAAFKAVDNSKQVAVLVPTTILAFQHWKVFTKRLNDFPVNIDYLNRFRTTKERTEIIKRLHEGKIDILIGTHQLINKTIKFKDLGLLIVDEEQKFGVAVKDKLKTIKENVDVLTLTATPIPRTLQFSLMSARDLSIINTPPPNRYPIESVVTPFSETLIRDAIMSEIQRDGQVFVIHNRIENIKEVSGMIQRLVPDAKIAIGHGQMDGKALEKVILDFMESRFDVLVSTSIVENGLDIPNANTIIINNAHSFGLSDLHQMRGRVGRSNKKAFCYFITIPKADMTNEARQRINAVEQFTELGGGFNIAMKDLEIRGSGDLLGGDQSGFIANIGFDTYQKILQTAIKELKESDFKDLKTESETEYTDNVQIDTDFEVLLPNEYVNNVKERLELYYKLAEVKNEAMLLDFKNNLIDRFGAITPEVENLLNSVRLKFIASRIGLERLVIKNNKMNGYFLANQQSNFYESSIFNTLLNKINHSPGLCQISQKETQNGLKLFLSFQKIESIEKGLKSLTSLL